MGVDSADHRNVEQQMLALGKEALMHSDFFEMLGLSSWGLTLKMSVTDRIFYVRTEMQNNRAIIPYL